MSRYSPNAFKYNDRVAVALLPSLIIIGSRAGRLVSGVLMAGAMFTYMMDTLRWREAAFASIWITLVISNFGFLISTVLMSDISVSGLITSLGLNGTTLLLVGIWATIQFKWMLIRHPDLVLLMEQMLISCALPTAMVVQSWGLTTAIGMELVPFPTMVIGCILYALCMQPLPSSFQKTHRGPGFSAASVRPMRIQGRFEGGLSAVSLCIFPAAVYAVSHLDVIFQPEHIWSIVLLISIPVLTICLLPDGLWWISDNPLVLQYLKATVAVTAGGLAVLGFEGRVIFHSFGSYIRLSFPLNWIVVSIFLFLKVLIVAAHIAGYLKNQTGFMMASCMLVVSACAGGIAVGLPLLLMPAPLTGAAGLALFYDSGLLRDYMAFCAGTIVTFCWMLWHHFWFLDVWVSGVPIRVICQSIAVVVVAALTIPGLLSTNIFDKITKRGVEGFLIVQAMALTFLEELLYAGVHDDDEITIYPAYLVLATSLIGIWFVRKLETREYISKVVGWILQCLYISKLPMLFLPEAHLVLPFLGVVLAVTPPILLIKKETVQLPSLIGSTMAGCIVVSVLLARMAIFDIIQALITAHPPEGLLLGTLILTAAGGCFPLFQRFYRRSHAARRSMVLSLALGALLCFLRPPLPLRGTVLCPNFPMGLCPRLWDERHIPDYGVDDLEMYGMGWTRRQHWPLWLLVASIMTGLAAITSGTPIQKSIASRLLWGTLGGLCVGCYLGLEFFPEHSVLQMLCVMSAVLGCSIVVLLQQPSEYGPLWMPVLVLMWAVLFPLMFVLQAELLSHTAPEVLRLFPDAPQLMRQERLRTGRAAVLAVYAAESLLIAFAIKLKIHQILRAPSNVPSRSGSSWDPRSGVGGYLSSASPSLRAFCGPGGWRAMFGAMVTPKVFDRMAGMMKMSGSGGVMLRRLSTEGLGWIPTVGNLITISAFLLCITLNVYFTNGKDVGIFAVVPVLLLLGQDPILFRDLGEKRRYFPVAIALIGCLICSSVYELIRVVITSQKISAVEWPMWYAIKNLCGLLASLPSLLYILYYLWSHDQMGHTLIALSLLLLSVFTVLITEISFIFDLGLMGVVGCLLMSIVYSRLRNTGEMWL